MELINQDVDLDKPGFAQFYCIHCAKYFIDDTAMQAHFRTKVRDDVILFSVDYLTNYLLFPLQVHKRRLKALETEPYSIEESERAAGAGSYIEAKKRILETQPTKEELLSGKKTVKCEIVVPEEEEENKME